MKMVRAADFINAMSVVPGHVISDIDLSCACPVCGEVQRLSDAIRHHPDDSHIVYRCRNAHSDAEPLVDIDTAGEFYDDESGSMAHEGWAVGWRVPVDIRLATGQLVHLVDYTRYEEQP